MIELLLQLDLSILRCLLVMGILLFNKSFAPVKLLGVISKLVSLLKNPSDLLSSFQYDLRLLLDRLLLKVNLTLDLVSEALVRPDFFNCAVQYCELLLQELHRVVRNILLHLQVKVLVAEGLILGKMLSKLGGKRLAHLFR